MDFGKLSAIPMAAAAALHLLMADPASAKHRLEDIETPNLRGFTFGDAARESRQEAENTFDEYRTAYKKFLAEFREATKTVNHAVEILSKEKRFSNMSREQLLNQLMVSQESSFQGPKLKILGDAVKDVEELLDGTIVLNRKIIATDILEEIAGNKKFADDLKDMARKIRVFFGMPPHEKEGKHTPVVQAEALYRAVMEIERNRAKTRPRVRPHEE